MNDYNELLDFILNQLSNLIFKIEEKRKRMTKKELQIIIKDGNGKELKNFYVNEEEKRDE